VNCFPLFLFFSTPWEPPNKGGNFQKGVNSREEGRGEERRGEWRRGREERREEEDGREEERGRGMGREEGEEEGEEGGTTGGGGAIRLGSTTDVLLVHSSMPAA
jgi:hypothetical protein